MVSRITTSWMNSCLFEDIGWSLSLLLHSKCCRILTYYQWALLRQQWRAGTSSSPVSSSCSVSAMWVGLTQHDRHMLHYRHPPEPTSCLHTDGGCCLEVDPEQLSRTISSPLPAKRVAEHDIQTVCGCCSAGISGWDCLHSLSCRQDQLGWLMTELLGPFASAEQKPTMVIPVSVEGVWSQSGHISGRGVVTRWTYL